MPYDCFVSYAAADLNFAEAVLAKLRAADFTVWFDRARLTPGCDWHREIEQGCETSRILLPVLTTRWKASEWTRLETYGAESVVPLVFEGNWADVSTAPLERYQAETIQANSLAEKDWTRLFASLRRLLDRPAPEKQNRLVHLDYRANDNFVGRDLDLIRIHEELHRNPRAVLTQGRVRAIAAMGGVGKTTLARQYAEKFWRCYPQMFWVDARKGLGSEFAIIHDLLFPSRTDIGLKVEDKARQALYTLSSPDTRLLIIDNAEDEMSTKAWIPKTGGCHTLITSRYSGWSHAVKVLPLAVLDKVSAVDFLQRRTERTLTDREHDHCVVLAETLGYLPLALEQAAAYIKALSISFGVYLGIYETSKSELLKLQAPGSTDHVDSVAATLRPSMQQIGRGALAILRLAATVATTPVPWRLFAARPELIFEQVRALAGPETIKVPSSFDFWILNEIETLVKYSLVAFDGQNLSLHPLLLTVQYEAQAMDERRLNWSVVAQLLVATSPLPTWKIDCRERWTLENDREWERRAPYVDRLLDLQGSIPEIVADPLFELFAVNTYASMAAYSRATSLCRALCEGLKVKKQEIASVLAEATDCLACLLKQDDHYQDALEQFRLLHQLLVKQRGKDDPGALRALHNAACLMELLGDTSGAESLMRDVLGRRQRLLGENHYDTCTSLHDVGWLLQNEQRWDEAEPPLRQALEHWKRTLGVANPDTRDAAANLALVLRNKGDFEQAVTVQQDLVDGIRLVMDPDHLACFEAMHNLALFQCNIGHDEEAHTIIAQVVDGYRRYLPPNHRDMLTALQDMGTVLGKLGRFPEAEPLLKEALAGYENTQAPDSKDILRTVKNLAGVLDKLGRTDEAKVLHLRHLHAIYAQGEMSPIDMRSAAHTCLSMGDYDLAERFLRQALATRVEVHGNRCHLARLYMLKGMDAEAREEIAMAWEDRANARPFYVVLRILFFQLVFCLLDGADPAGPLGLMKGAFSKEGASGTWGIQMVIDHLKVRLSPTSVDLLEAIASGIDDNRNVKRLDAFPEWLNAPLLALD